MASARIVGGMSPPVPAQSQGFLSPAKIALIVAGLLVFTTSVGSLRFALALGLPAIALAVIAGIARRHPMPPTFARRVASWTGRPGVTPWVVVLAGTTLTGGAIGVWGTGLAESQRKAACASGREAVRARLDEGKLSEAAKALDQAQKACGPELQPELAVIGRELSTKFAAQQEEEAAAKRAADAKAQAGREVAAVANWKIQAAAVRAKLKEAASAAARGAWGDADTALYDASNILGAQYGTSVQQKPEWAELSKQLADQRKRIQPQLDKLEAARAKREADAAKQRVALEAEREQDRKNLVWYTKNGYLGAATEAKLDQAITLLATGDEAAFAKLLATDPGVFWLKPGIKVNVVDAGSLFGGKTKVRARGTLLEFWTVREAIEQP